MARETIRDRLIAALEARGSTKVEDAITRKYVVLTGPLGIFFYVGKAGALRRGGTIRGSVPCSHVFRRQLLGEVVAKDVH